ncbi:MAG: rod shape-determining protein MreC [Rikenellaceae bacterium]|jgi:rod shape-determining protein MreC|nr:rod shape-determining protein MreC [Rikenellaceae bacterium]
MYKFVLFLKKIQFLLLFAVIEVVALHFYANGSSYNYAKFINVSNYLVGDIYAGVSQVKQFFTLGDENRRLNREVSELRSALEHYRATMPEVNMPDRLLDSLHYAYVPARVVNNSLGRQQNYLTLTGDMREVTPDMAVVAGGNVVGYVVERSDRFAVAVSILNTRFSTGGRIKKQSNTEKESSYFGSIRWDGHRTDEVTLTEIPKYAEILPGDTVITTEYSSIFPPGLNIGTVVGSELINATYYDVRVKLFADMGTLNNVVLVRYTFNREKTDLEERARQHTEGGSDDTR